MFECFTGVPPFNDESKEKVYENIKKGEIVWPTTYSEDEIPITKRAIDFMKKLLEPNPSLRLGHNGFQEIKEHKFFKGFDWESLPKGEVPIVPEIEPIDTSNIKESDEKLQNQFSSKEKREDQQYKEFDGANFQALSHKNSELATIALRKFNKKKKKQGNIQRRRTSDLFRRITSDVDFAQEMMMLESKQNDRERLVTIEEDDDEPKFEGRNLGKRQSEPDFRKIF